MRSRSVLDMISSLQEVVIGNREMGNIPPGRGVLMFFGPDSIHRSHVICSFLICVFIISQGMQCFHPSNSPGCEGCEMCEGCEGC